MFKLSRYLVKENENKAYSVCDGLSFPIEDVSDDVFSSKMMGDGIALLLKGDILFSPCDGEIIFCADTKHAIGIKTRSGIEILIHIGLDTVNLNGNGFHKVFTGSHVKRGQPLMKIDLDYMKENQIDLTTMLVVTNLNGHSIINKVYNTVTIKDMILEFD